MPNEPIWPLVDELIELNRYIVEDTGEPHALLKPNELESACDRPRNLWNYGDPAIALMAASLILGVARNHPFEQGNKRTAFVAGLVFLENNGFIFDHPDSDDFAPLIEAAVTGDITENDLAEEIDLYLVETLF